MDLRDNSFSEGQTAQILVEFLEVAITSIVYLKGLYPAGAFERRRYLNLVVHQARHPTLLEYIHSAVSSLRPFIQKIAGGRSQRTLGPFLKMDQAKMMIRLFGSQPARVSGIRLRLSSLQLYLEHHSLPSQHPNVDPESFVNPIDR